MAKPKIPNQKKKYKELNKRLKKYISLVEKLYQSFNLKILNIVSRTNYDGDNGKVFKFSDYPQIRKPIEDVQYQFSSDMSAIILNGMTIEWNQSNSVQDVIANKALSTYGISDKKEYSRYYQTNTEALKAFQKRQTEGMNLSKNVWNLSEQYKKELEMAISVGIEKGTSANELARKIQKYLNEPDRLFRKVRDKYGNLELSRNAKAYHPGRGVYRSSFKNALRLARSEINMAYRKAEQLRWQQMDFIVAYEIKLSGSHEERMPDGDICDKLAGKYPKGFVWTGWHPNDMCYAVPIFKTDDEFWGLNDKKESVNKINDVPDEFKKWIQDNIYRAKSWETAPYFIRDNSDYIREDFKVNVYNQTEKSFVRKRRTNLAMSRVEFYNKGYPDIPEVQLAAINAYTQAATTGNKGATSREINRRLRNGTEDDYVEAASTLISQGLKELPSHQGVVYRGETMSMAKLQERFLDHIGGIVSDKGFFSASLYLDTPQKFISHDGVPKSHKRVIFEIQSKNGRDISRISEFNGIFTDENQHEILFDKQTKFLIPSKPETKNGIVYISLIEQ